MPAIMASRRRAPAKPRRVGHVFVISSPSGGGKTTVVDRLRRRLPRLKRSVSVTTRPPRPGERNGRDYYFVSEQRFGQLRRRKQLLEWAKVHGAYYGTPRRPVLDTIARGRDMILSIDVQGARQIQRALGRRAVLVFLLPPSIADLRRRLQQRRTDTSEAIRKRLAASRRELACASWYDVRVVNDHLERAVRDVLAVVRTTQQKG